MRSPQRVQRAYGAGILISALLRHCLLKLDYGKIKHNSDVFKLNVSAFKSFYFFTLWVYLEYTLVI